MWTSVLVAGAVFGAAALALWLRAPLIAAGLLGGAFAAALVYHGYFLWRLNHWAALPEKRVLPLGIGAWRTAFERLVRMLREARNAERGLGAELERLRDAIDKLPSALIILDRYQHVAWCNLAAMALLGVVGVNRPIHHFVRQPEFAAWLERGDASAPLVLTLPKQPGRLFSLRVHVAEPGGYALLTMRDITEESRLDAMRRDFVANVSHEIRTPLTVIAGFVETMLDLPLDENERRRQLATILRQTETMRQLVEDLLALSALETAGEPPDDARVDIHQMLRSTVIDLRALSAGRHEISLQTAGPRFVLAQPMDLQTAIRNLLTNAARYTPENGRIAVEWRVRGDEGWLSVRDDGIGIAPEHLPRLTERFYRVDRSRSRDSGGTGLGLAIVKHILQRHQARLDIRSRLGQGSTFSIVMPPERLVAEGADAAAGAGAHGDDRPALASANGESIDPAPTDHVRRRAARR
ncbi:MAG: phosphate regulon sensor histidine kinase PhoR [Burkholderiales bacterium]|nr:MAG: phosphate regulon sensor histidine kinase PhoR [Burkholderiales bacterium]